IFIFSSVTALLQSCLKTVTFATTVRANTCLASSPTFVRFTPSRLAFASTSSATMATNFTEPTTNYWQKILPSDHGSLPPWKFGVPARLPDSRILMLPIRPLNDGSNDAVASLLVNQAAIDVVEDLGTLLAEIVRPFQPEVIIGLPTLGLTLAPIVAQKIGLKRYVPLGYSRKFWYQDELSTDVSSITSPTVGLKKVYLDPHQLPLVQGLRAVIIDDAVSSGRTLQATWDMLEGVGCDIRGCGIVMKQGSKWMDILGPDRTGKLVYVLESPLLRAVDDGWDVRP
ncbi:Adenine phosphoribosyltransferase, partial [Hyphodiscus hymeniophilus]